MLRRLHFEQPKSFAFTPDNLKWAEAQMTKYPEGRQASAIIPLLWRAQEQEGWLSRPAIETVADMLGMDYIRALEVATFYFMFQLQPVGQVAHFQICGTTSCMIMGAEDLIAVMKDKIAAKPHEISADGKFSWEEVECLGSCSNAPMAQIGKDYYEDLTPARLGEILDDLAKGEVPVPGPQNGRYGAEPLAGLTSLTEHESGKTQYNASVQLATDLGETVKRIDGSEVPLTTPWLDAKARGGSKPAAKKAAAKKPAAKKAAAKPAAKPKAEAKPAAATGVEKKPRTMKAPRKSGADDLKLITGVGPKLEGVLNELGFWHFDQIAKWTGDEIAWVDSRLKFKGRIERDNWIDQAKTLAEGGEG
ncbi:NADH-quinone oxidoreductase subunit NuoE [Alisedimentitalea sp. MJ-SS2]|uniref:NADH-quinone oxidoreductase subunit NuoE n=1 Tax=Aliisedimentitalea sp. MJ-SS2 TaxID=3049795 RepID=UPI00291248C9|nr:NADH-quinone oxidoreductase subunit NuoE [Alisedimentitalea sp. MJ-SS2]MDU8929035.1 NADH-quinone oxidoreductase subunit NuoE [Alisedimentitalea sp. MJ-SS2]